MRSRQVLEALQKAVIQAVKNSNKPDLPIKMMGRVYKPDGNPWLEVVQITNDVANLNWGKEHVYQGFIRLILHWPVDDMGAYEPLEVIESIACYFEKGDILEDPENNVLVKINNNPRYLGSVEEQDHLMYPYSVEYRFYDINKK